MLAVLFNRALLLLAVLSNWLNKLAEISVGTGERQGPERPRPDAPHGLDHRVMYKVTPFSVVISRVSRGDGTTW